MTQAQKEVVERVAEELRSGLENTQILPPVGHATKPLTISINFSHQGMKDLLEALEEVKLVEKPKVPEPVEVIEQVLVDPTSAMLSGESPGMRVKRLLEGGKL